MRRATLYVGVVIGAVIAVVSCERDEQPLLPATPAAQVEFGPPTAAPQPTRPVTVEVVWVAAAGVAGEAYSEGRFAPPELRYGERFVVQRVCVSDPRKLTAISYTDTVGHTDVPLTLGSRGTGRVDPSDGHCTLFDDIEIARVEKCKCWFQCAGERHTCTVTGYARRD